MVASQGQCEAQACKKIRPKSGRYVSVAEIRYRLGTEGYFTDTISGPHLCEQLKADIETARKMRHKPGRRR